MGRPKGRKSGQQSPKKNPERSSVRSTVGNPVKTSVQHAEKSPLRNSVRSAAKSSVRKSVRSPLKSLVDSPHSHNSNPDVAAGATSSTSVTRLFPLAAIRSPDLGQSPLAASRSPDPNVRRQPLAPSTVQWRHRALYAAAKRHGPPRRNSLQKKGGRKNAENRKEAKEVVIDKDPRVEEDWQRIQANKQAKGRSSGKFIFLIAFCKNT